MNRRRLASVLIVMLAGALLHPLPAAGVSGGPFVVLYPIHKGMCDPTTGSADGRQLSISYKGATQCPDVGVHTRSDPGSIRWDEEYKLAEPLKKRLSTHSRIAGKITFDQRAFQADAPGMVDATVELVLNDEKVLSADGAGTVSPDEPYTMEFDAPVPASLRGEVLSYAGLFIYWKRGTTPGVEPSMDENSWVKLPLMPDPPPTGTLKVKLDQDRFVECPPKYRHQDCRYVHASGKSPRFGRLLVRRVVVFPSTGQPCPKTEGRLTFLDEGNATISFRSSRAICLTQPMYWPFDVVFTGGTGVYRGVSGSAKIQDYGGRGETWKGQVHVP